MVIAITAVLLFASGLSKSVKDTLAHHFYTSIFRKLNPKFWDPSVSWTNKYKGGEEMGKPRFWGSTTFFAWLTDAWHLFDTIQATCWQVALTVNLAYAFHLNLPWFAGLLLGIKALISIPFELTYSKLFRK